LANNVCDGRQLLCQGIILFNGIGSLLYFNSIFFKSDVTDWMSAMVSYKKWANAISVFSVKKSLQEDCEGPTKLGYSLNDTAQNTNGEFNISKGTFTVKTPGIYLFHISGYYNFIQRVLESGSIQLRVNNQQVSSQSFINEFYGTEENEDCSVDFEQDTKPIVLSSFVSLKTGDKVNSFAEDLFLIEKEDVYTTRFSGVYFPD